MPFILHYQQNGGEDAWVESMADQRRHIIEMLRPRFITVLDVDTFITATSSKEEIADAKYRGPFYIDWDAEDLTTAIEKVQQFLGKLREMTVDLAAIRLFATGGRGFHCEIPCEMFLAKVPVKGITFLPAIYKEIAFDVYVDTMDMRVYSARKGRQWRTPNVQRENGAYKVPITVAEMDAMTPTLYGSLCSSPRPEPAYAEPALNMKLAVIFAKAEQKVQAAQKRRKNSVQDAALLGKFAGKFPPTLLKVMLGEGTADGIGFHQIAMQIAITAGALGKKDDAVLPLCEGLIANHKSDGSRYNTPAKRRAELQRMLRYCEDNVCYSYSRDAVRKLVPTGTPAPDLDGLTEASGTVISVDGEIPDDGMLGGVFMTEMGVFRKSEDGVMKLSNLAFKEVAQLVHSVSLKPLGFEVELLVDGKPRGSQRLNMDTFLSKNQYQRFAMGNGGVFMGNDNHVAALTVKLRELAELKNATVYVVHKEGLDLIRQPGNREKLDMVWVTPDEVTGSEDLPVKYKFQSAARNNSAYNTDLMDAPFLKNDDLTGQVITALMNMNKPYVMAALLSWTTACFHRRIYHHLYDQFPLCQVFGQAGSGKTTILRTLQHFFYYLTKPPQYICGGGTTKWTVEDLVQGSASIPAALDEYKPSSMGPVWHERFKTIFRAAYNDGDFGKGGVAADVGGTWRDTTRFTYSAPIIFVGEGLEAETAVLERSVVVPVSPNNLTGADERQTLVRDNSVVLSSIGKDLVNCTFSTDLDAFKAAMDVNRRKAKDLAFQRNNFRVVYNLAVLLNSLDYLEMVLAEKFGTAFAGEFTRLRDALCDTSNQVATSVMSEATKVLNSLALMSRTEDPMSEFGLLHGREYVYTGSGANLVSLQIKMREVWVKYMAWTRHKGLKHLYDSEEAFLHGFAQYGALEDKMCLKSPLKQVAFDKVYSFKVKTLDEEGVETFKHSL